jgi:hypothetical protein
MVIWNGKWSISQAPEAKEIVHNTRSIGWEGISHGSQRVCVTSVILSVQYARISVQVGYIYRYDGQCTIICTAFSRGMFQYAYSLSRAIEAILGLQAASVPPSHQRPGVRGRPLPEGGVM